mmetsp:Transcript_40612/g.94316  ORF Transcript_40612/g.94316 Transcript_40612/m.94316 type:complete len:226 (+) Transcript_40612:1409-2086(+)
MPCINTALIWHHAIEKGVQVAGEAGPHGQRTLERAASYHIAALAVRPGPVRQDHTFGSTFWNVLVFILLRECQVVALVKQRGKVAIIDRLIPRQDEPDPATSHIPETGVEAHEVSSTNEVDAIRHLRVKGRGPVFEGHGRVQSEGKGPWSLVLEEVRQKDAVVESEEHVQDLSVLLIGAGVVNHLAQLLIEAGLGLAMCDAREVVEKEPRQVRMPMDKAVDPLCG